MPSLLSLLSSSHFKRVGNIYSLADAVVNGYTLGAGSLQLDKRSFFPVERHTPGGAVLGSANLAQSIRNASDAVQDAGTGGWVLIPPGSWEIGEESIEIIGAGRNNPVGIAGAGMDITRIVLPTGYSGTAFKLTGSPPSPELYYNGGLSDLSVSCESEDASNDGVGIHIEGTANMQFRNVTVRNFTGGSCWKATRGDPDYTNQYVQWHNCTASGGYINYDWQSVVNSQAYGLYSAGSRYRDYLLDDVKASIYGGNMQSSPAICVELAGDGGCRVVFYDYYWEGINPSLTMFKCNSPGVTSSVLEVHGFHLGGSPGTFLDTDLYNNCVLDQVYGINNAAKVLKARNGAPVMMINCGSPISLPGQFDLDDASRAVLTCYEVGQAYVGGKWYVGKSFALPAANENSEPASPAAGDLIYNGTSNRPRVLSDATWHDLAFADDALSLNDLLSPYAAEILDPSVAGKRSVISSELDSLTGLMHGSTIAALSSGQRPAFTTADDDFGGRPSFTCESASTGKFLQGTLGASIAAGSYPGLFIVGSVVTPLGGSARCSLGLCEASDHSSAILICADDVNVAGHYGAVYADGATVFAVAGAAIDTGPHVIAAYADPPTTGGLGFRFDLEAASVATPGAGPLTSALTKLSLGASWDGADYSGADIKIAYVAVLKSAVPVAVMSRAISLARARYGLF